MSIDDQNSPHAANDDAVAQLIRNAGRREKPPAQAYERTLQIATQAWRGKVRRRRYTVAGVVSAIAASVLVALALGWRVLTPETVKPQVARADRIVGPVQVRSDASGWILIDDDRRAFHVGESIKTGPASRAGLLLGNSHSLRLAEATEVRMLAESRVELIAGKAYIATVAVTDAAAARPVEIVTPVGTASDVGTQFEIQYRDERYRLRVREGAVVLQRDFLRIRSATGEQLMIDRDGELRREAVSPTDPGWDWVEAVAPAVAIDGQPLTVLLDWVARETGRSVRYADAATQRRAATTILHGSIDELAPLQALGIMLATTDLRHRLLDDGTIMIEAQAK